MKKYIIAILAVTSFVVGWITYNGSIQNKQTNNITHEVFAVVQKTTSSAEKVLATPESQEFNHVAIIETQQSISIANSQGNSVIIEDVIKLDDIYEVSSQLLKTAQTAKSSENQEALFQNINKLQENESFSSLYLTHHQCDSNHCLISIEGLQNLTQENTQKLKQELLFGDVGNILPGKGGTFYFHEQNDIKSIRVIYDTKS